MTPILECRVPVRGSRWDDRGGIPVFVALIIGPLLLLCGLLTVDAFGVLRAKQHADDLSSKQPAPPSRPLTQPRRSPAEPSSPIPPAPRPAPASTSPARGPPAPSRWPTAGAP